MFPKSKSARMRRGYVVVIMSQRRKENRKEKLACKNSAQKHMCNRIIHVFSSLSWLSLLLRLDTQATQALREQAFRSVRRGVTDSCAIKSLSTITSIVFV